MPLTTLLVANRGEIARRIFRTARRMGMRTAAVFSDADAGAPFTREADLALRLGPAPARDSYLAIPRILEAARTAAADLVHPGYGFLAEEPAFARAVAAERLGFVGPPADVIAALGDKGAAKALAERAGVPVLPGYRGADQRDEALIAAARGIGYPLMVKPVAGGGGIGMVRVAAAGELREALARARRTARAAFGDERLLLERTLIRPRHVEVQILADAHGTVLAVGDRDCSAQRRHQKVLEEAPAPGLAPATRAALHDAAVRVARAAGYRSAGTVEFLLDEAGAFFFLEVNARLQVEHPVTEVISGIDLVEQQLRIALGERLDLAPVAPRGHAIEVRLYAEDAAAGFLPATGTAAHVHWPAGVRVDAGIEEGVEVTAHYDPLLAKLIAHGDDREAAFRALAEAFRETEVLGVRTNLAFLRALVAHAPLRGGPADTELIGRDLAVLAPAPERAPTEARALAAATALAAVSREGRDPWTTAGSHDAGSRERRDPWTALGPWRAGRGSVATIVLRDGDAELAIEVAGEGPYVALGHRLARETGHHRWTVDGMPASVALARGGAWVAWRGATHELPLGAGERSVEAVAGELVAPMPGQVLAVHVRAGQAVRRGELLLVIEAMKMELRIEAPADGTVTAVRCAAGDVVERGKRLAEFEPAGEGALSRAIDRR